MLCQRGGRVAQAEASAGVADVAVVLLKYSLSTLTWGPSSSACTSS